MLNKQSREWVEYEPIKQPSKVASYWIRVKLGISKVNPEVPMWTVIAIVSLFMLANGGQ